MPVKKAAAAASTSPTKIRGKATKPVAKPVAKAVAKAVAKPVAKPVARVTATKKRSTAASTIAKAASSSAASSTITLKHLAAQLAADHELVKRQAEAMVTDMIGLIVKHLRKGKKVRLVGLGILQVRKRAARMGHNPATREKIKIKASKTVAFRAAKDLKEAI